MSAETADVHHTHPDEHPHKTTLDRLIYMANQIGWFFKSQPAKQVVPGILDHIQHFWDPRMRAEIFRYIEETDGSKLEPPVLMALTLLREAEAKKREGQKVDTGQQRAGEAPKHVTHSGEG